MKRVVSCLTAFILCMSLLLSFAQPAAMALGTADPADKLSQPLKQAVETSAEDAMLWIVIELTAPSLKEVEAMVPVAKPESSATLEEIDAYKAAKEAVQRQVYSTITNGFAAKYLDENDQIGFVSQLHAFLTAAVPASKVLTLAALVEVESIGQWHNIPEYAQGSTAEKIERPLKATMENSPDDAMICVAINLYAPPSEEIDALVPVPMPMVEGSPTMEEVDTYISAKRNLHREFFSAIVDNFAAKFLDENDKIGVLSRYLPFLVVTVPNYKIKAMAAQEEVQSIGQWHNDPVYAQGGAADKIDGSLKKVLENATADAVVPVYIYLDRPSVEEFEAMLPMAKPEGNVTMEQANAYRHAYLELVRETVSGITEGFVKKYLNNGEPIYFQGKYLCMVTADVAVSKIASLAALDEVTLISSAEGHDALVYAQDNCTHEYREETANGKVSYVCIHCGDTWVLSDSNPVVDHGQCGENAFWKLTKDGTLTISGTGTVETGDPWRDAHYGDITAIVIEDGITALDSGIFWYNQRAVSVVLPDSLTAIGDRTFQYCVSLQSVTIPAGVTSIGRDAFNYCQSLKEITFTGNAPSIGADAFGNSVTATVYYPANDPTWTEKVRQNYGGTLTWVPYEKPLAITRQPETFVGPVGSAASFHVEAEGEGLTYQWFYSKDGVDWFASTAEGATTATLCQTFTANRVGQLYRCEVRNNKGEVLTTEAVFMCEALPPITIESQPESFMGRTGETGMFHVAASGKDLTYQWYYSKDNGVTWSKSSMDGSTTDTMRIQLTAARAGQCYRCEIQDADGNVASSEQAAIKLETENIEIKYQPVSANGYIGETTTFHVEATGMGLTYQWYYSKNGGQTWSPSGMAGFDTDTLKVQLTAARVGQVYRCAITDNKGATVNSDVVAMNQKNSVPGVFEIKAQPQSFTGKVGDTAVFFVDAVGENLTFRWQFSKDGKTWEPSGLPGNRTDTLRVSMTASRVGQSYRCVIIDAKGKQLISDPVLLNQA